MITYLLFILIGCQSLPVISIGGSTFKIYELLGLILLMQGIKCRRMLFLQCCFFYFIIAPCLSLLWGCISRKTKCSAFTKHFVPKSHSLTQFKMWFKPDLNIVLISIPIFVPYIACVCQDKGGSGWLDHLYSSYITLYAMHKHEILDKKVTSHNSFFLKERII